MSNVTSKALHRLLAAFLSFVMVFSMIPFSMVATAATETHPDAVTITVVDDVTGEPIEGAKVTYVIYDNDLGEETMGDDDVPTDANGEVVIFDGSEPGNIKVSSVIVTHEDYATYTNAAYDQIITSLQDNFTIKMTCIKIKDVDVAGKNLTYTGEAQELVSVTEVEGDTVEYYLNGATEPATEVPTATDAGTYSVRVVVTRAGKDPLDKTVETVIKPADIEGIDIAPVTGLKYNEADQALVTLIGEFAEGDKVTWTVGVDSVNTWDIPKRKAVGSYKVTLTVERGDNYNKFERTVDVEIALGDLDLGELKIEAVDRIYDTTEKPLLDVTKDGDYTLEYSTDEKATWVKDVIPVGTDVGEYVIYVKATKDGYNEKTTVAFPITVTISKASQSFDFDEYDAMENDTNPEGVELKGSVPYGQTYDFSATDTAALAGGTITYEIIADEDVATITADGILTVNHPGAITVIAKLSGNKNYKDCEIRYYLNVTGAVSSNGQYIEFAEAEKNFVIGTDSTISEQKADKKDRWISGDIAYSINNIEGIVINPASGKLTVTDIDKFVEAVRAGNNVITVTAKKAATRWYGADEISYKVNVSFETTPTDPYTLSAVDGTNGWYKTKATVTPAAGYTIAQNAGDAFAESTDFSNQGTDVRYVYLKNTTTGGITDRIAVNVKIDSETPTNLKIEFSKLNFIQKVGQFLGFYNPDVTITFTAEDVMSGIDHFDWTYTPESGTPVTEQVDVTVSGNKATATITLPANQADQLHGKISFTATDKANNVFGIDDDYVFIVDTIAPELSVKYQGQEPYTAQQNTYNGAHFFNSDVVVELTISETNFYAEDVVVKVSKDNGTATAVTPSWDGKVGTFTLAGDGDYVVYVTYTDKSNNPMAEYTSETITVDKTAPVVKIDYVHNGETQKTVFTVTEHNFRASDVVITGTMKDITGTNIPSFTAEQLTALLQNAQWTQNGDVYTYEYDQYINGRYNLKIDYKDIAGWEATQFVSPEFIIDHGAPTGVKIEYAKTPLDTFLEVITLGFYNPSVTIRFTAYDTSAGVQSFTWSYTKETGASTVNHPETLADATVTAVQDPTDESKFTAEITLTAKELAQYRGYISVIATDKYQNKSNKVVDSGNIIVVDTVTPTISVEYPIEANRVDADNKINYYNKDIQVKFIVTEANFYPEEMQVTITKDGQPIDFDTSDITWGVRDSEDKTIGTFTLAAPADHSKDGDYVITVNYKDRSSNEMATYVSKTFTIDTIKPVINVIYDNEDVINTLKDSEGHDRKYFKADQTAKVSITEHNFNAEDVELTVVAVDVTGQKVTVKDYSAYAKVKENWVRVGDTYALNMEGMLFDVDANYTFSITYSDMATNQTEYDRVDYFTVDKTAPELVSVKYRKSAMDEFLEVITLGFYQAPVDVELVVSDNTSEVHEFDYQCIVTDNASSVNKGLTGKNVEDAEGVTIKKDGNNFATYFTIPQEVLTAVNQFNGKIDFVATNRSGVAYSYSGNTQIIVDNIAPTVQVSYNDATNVVGDISYYNGNINATVTVNEANFYAEDVKVTVSKDGAAGTAVTPKWTDTNVDVHVGTFTLSEDGDYVVTITYTDRSNNEMATYTSKQMTIDTKIDAPTYTINDQAKTEVGGAYKGEAEIGFNFADQNFDTKTITLTRTRFDKVEDVTETFIKVTDNDKGGSGSFTIPTEVGNDGIYVLKITMTDKAKHEVESEVKFTINRYGSVYEYSDELVALINNGGQYIKSADNDLVITEYNADRILEGSLQILITRDGETVDVDFTSNPENINAQVGIGESGWYQYVYTIKASNFEKDGVYKISLTSKYAADDSPENESTSVPENSIDEQGKAILDTMNFTVDSVAPEIRNIVSLEESIINAQTVDVKYTIVDVGGLKSIEVILNGRTIDTITEFGDSVYNYSGQFTINESSDAQTIQIKVTDLAGNVTDTASEDFSTKDLYVFNDRVTVSTNIFVRWYANKGLFWGSIGGVIVVAGALWFFLAGKKKKKEEATAK